MQGHHQPDGHPLGIEYRPPFAACPVVRARPRTIRQDASARERNSCHDVTRTVTKHSRLVRGVFRGQGKPSRFIACSWPGLCDALGTSQTMPELKTALFLAEPPL